MGAERLVGITGNDALTGFTAPKLVWVRDHEPEIWARGAHILLPKDYVRLRLTGEHAIDKADGSGTILFDLAARDWSAEVLEALGIDAAWLPRTFEGTEVTGTVTAEAAAATGLRAGTPVVAGGGDQAANAVGVGAVVPGRMALSLGTSGVVFATTDRAALRTGGPGPRLLPRGAGPLALHVGDALGGGQPALVPRHRWRRESRSATLAADAGGVPVGSDGLLFLPYLSGERCPYPDPLARGAFVGLTLGHDRRHLTRAVLEGVAFGLRDGLDLMVAAGMPAPAQILASGGGTASPLWRQILADVLDAEIATVNTTEGAAFGAALLAAVGAGWFPRVEAAAEALVTATAAAATGRGRRRATRSCTPGTGSCTRRWRPSFHRS